MPYGGEGKGMESRLARWTGIAHRLLGVDDWHGQLGIDEIGPDSPDPRDAAGTHGPGDGLLGRLP